MIADNYSSKIALFLGEGAANFGMPQFVSTGLNPVDVGVADFNDDGKSDIAALDIDYAGVWLLCGSDAGTFTASVNYGVGLYPAVLLVADFNQDGKPDAASANTGSSNVSLLLNQCAQK